MKLKKSFQEYRVGTLDIVNPDFLFSIVCCSVVVHCECLMRTWGQIEHVEVRTKKLNVLGARMNLKHLSKVTFTFVLYFK